MSKILRRLLLLAVSLFLCAGVLAASRDTWLRWMGESLVLTGPPCKADLVVVLAGDYGGNRIEKASELVKAGWAPMALVSGAGTCYGINEGEMAIQFAVREGYPASEFFNLTSPARSTAEEAPPIVAELRRRGVHRFILVTSDFHTRRAAKIYRKAAPDIPFCVVAAPDPDFTPNGWWHTREGRKIAFTESLKTITSLFGI